MKNPFGDQGSPERNAASVGYWIGWVAGYPVVRRPFVVRLWQVVVLVASVMVGVVGSARAQSLPLLPRSTSVTGLNDSALTLISDSARRTRAGTVVQLRKALSAGARWDSIAPNLLSIGGTTVNGVATFTGLQLFATGQRVDSATGAARAQVLTTARTINGVSFDGSGNITVAAAAGTLTGAALAAGVTSSSLTTFGVGARTDSTTGAARSQVLTTARSLWGQSFDGSAAITGPLSPSDGTAAIPAYKFSNTTDTVGVYRFGLDTIGFSTKGVSTLKISGGLQTFITGGTNGLNIVAGLGNSKSTTMYATDNTGALLTAMVFSGGAVGSAQITPALSFRPNFAGSVTNPIYGVNNTDTLGLYRFGKDTLGITANGILQMEIGMGGLLTLPILPSEGATKNAMCWDGTTHVVTQNAAATCTVSARRFKKNIVPLASDSAARIVSAIRTYTYNERAGGRAAFGVIAEEVDSLSHRLASRDARGVIASANYEQITVLLLKVVQDLQGQVDSLKATPPVVVHWPDGSVTLVIGGSEVQIVPPTKRRK